MFLTHTDKYSRKYVNNDNLIALNRNIYYKCIQAHVKGYSLNGFKVKKNTHKALITMKLNWLSTKKTIIPTLYTFIIRVQFRNG